MVARYLRRGMVAGLVAGLLAGLFAFLVGEPLLDRAIGLEESAAHGSGSHSHEGSGGASEEAFGRDTQKAGLFFATGLSGVFLGGLFGMAFAYFRGRMASRNDWARSLYLAAAVIVGVVLIPFLKYPGNPPSVGGSEDIGIRTLAYFTLIGFSLLAVVAAWYLSGILRERGVRSIARYVAVGLGLVAVVSGLFVVLPPAVDPGNFPVGLLWSFRLSTLGTQLVMWIGLGMVFGALCERAKRREEAVGEEGRAARRPDAGSGAPSPGAR